MFTVQFRCQHLQCSCCIDPSFKMQGDTLRAYRSSGKSGMLHNSVRGEQITPQLENKALVQKSKTILSLRYCSAVPILYFLVSSL